jgi:threonine dehydrogenase-like Zn-dependent dehydrogenase
MQAARLYAYEEHMQVDLTLEMVPEPTMTVADEVIVRVGAAGLCRTDLHSIEGVWRDAMDPEGMLLPYILGHENAGWVEDVGTGVHAVKPGHAEASRRFWRYSCAAAQARLHLTRRKESNMLCITVLIAAFLLYPAGCAWSAEATLSPAEAAAFRAAGYKAQGKK